MAFVIDRDYVSEAGEPHMNGKLFQNPDDDKVLDLDRDLTHRFRIYDSDRELYYEGRSDDSSSFEPLEWAQWYAGATEIRYLEGGKWRTL